MSIFESMRTWARQIKRDSVTLWFASRHPDAPWLPKAICIIAVAYALSPIDLVPDFIPVLGYVDDVILLPALLWLAVRLMPAPIIEASRANADRWMADQGIKPRSYAGAIAIVAIWLAAAGLCWYWLT
ncbi:MAG TPA: YkvA family protein [Thiobacillaceae bacterium]|nr:YkvA family protein [Thiobacillaceae bacterium]